MKAYYVQEGEVLKEVLYIPLFFKEEDIIPKDVKILGERCFSFVNSIKTIVIPENITTIKQGAFYNNKGLETVIIPSSVQKIEDGAFAGCDSLKEVYYTSNTIFGKNCFNHCSKLNKLVCDNTEAKIFYFKHTNNFALTFLIESEKDYNLYSGFKGDEYFPQGNIEDAGEPSYFIQSKKGNIWYAKNKDECLTAIRFQDSKKSFSSFFNKTITLDGKLTPMDFSFLTGICYNGRQTFKNIFGGDDYTEWPVESVLSFLNRRYPKLEKRFRYALAHQNVYDPLLSIDNGLGLPEIDLE